MKQLLFGVVGITAVAMTVVVAARQDPPAKTDDAVTRAILSGSPVPRDIAAVRRRLQTELGGTLTTHLVANGGHEHPTRRGVMFMSFESYAGPMPGGRADDGDLFLGYFLEPQGNQLVVGTGFVELIAWDRTTQRFNFWELIDGTWHFRGNSDDVLENIRNINVGASAPSFAFPRRSSDGTPILRCSGCHTLGAPIMKEIEAPHNDWWTETGKLALGSFTPNAEAAVLFEHAADASNLSTLVKKGAERLVAARAESSAADTPQRRLRSLFSTMEMNLVSDTVPFTEREERGTAVEIPVAFFVDPRLAPSRGPIAVDLATYKEALVRVDSRFPTKTSSTRESRHAFLVPAPSFVDTRVVDDLVKRGVLDEELMADVLAVDLAAPVYSGARASLIRFVPPSAANAAELRQKLTATLRKAPADDLAAQELLANFTDQARTAAAHRARAAAYLDACAKAADSVDAVESWLRLAAQRRAAIEASETALSPQGVITEAGFRVLFPVQLSATPAALHMNPKTGRAER